jgi:hypothetical protein
MLSGAKESRVAKMPPQKSAPFNVAQGVARRSVGVHLPTLVQHAAQFHRIHAMARRRERSNRFITTQARVLGNE